MQTRPRQRIGDTILAMSRSTWIKILLAIIALALLGVLIDQIPAVNQRLSWRIDIALTYLRGIIQPAGAMPTPETRSEAPSPGMAPSPTFFPTPLSLTPLTHNEESPIEESASAPPTPTPTLTPPPSQTPIPERLDLPTSGWEQQDWNNCGPATLSMYLHYYGWEGNQFDISALLKPKRNDRNVNVEELDYYIRNYAGWLNTQYRVGGNTELLKKFIAAEVPVMIESSFYFAGAYWPNDDLWAAHYLLVTGYDEGSQTFTVQNTYHGPDQRLDYKALDEYWKPFNRVFILVFLPGQEEMVKSILGSEWDETINRQHALEDAQAEIDADPGDAFAWFNLGTNLLYFERYDEAAAAYDQARTYGLPQRMLRYQFGPFFAYFHAGRNGELLTLTEYALQRTPNSEEALLWHGWALYRQGNINGAIADFQAALEANYNYQDAQYALDFVTNQ